MIELSVKEEEQLVLKKVLMKKHQAIAVDKTDEKFEATENLAIFLMQV